jgi:hypothetical protein
MLIGRAIVETSINLKYLTLNINDELCDKFVKSSLSYEKKLLEYIQNKIGSRGQEEFEKRILNSITNNFSKTKFKPDDVVFSRDRKWSADLFSLSEQVDLAEAYETMYRYLSRAEHGSWQHLEQYNLKEGAEFYKPELMFHRPDPQLICGVSLMSVVATISYYDYIVIKNNLFRKYLSDLVNWLCEISNKYNTFKDS